MFCGFVTQRVAIGSCRGRKRWPLSVPAGDSSGAASGSLLGVHLSWMKIFHPLLSGKGGLGICQCPAECRGLCVVPVASRDLGKHPWLCSVLNRKVSPKLALM